MTAFELRQTKTKKEWIHFKMGQSIVKTVQKMRILEYSLSKYSSVVNYTHDFVKANQNFPCIHIAYLKSSARFYEEQMEQ